MGFIRLLLALSVILGHSQPICGYFGVAAAVAVSAFFMISGFYMAMICTEKYNGPNGTRAFYSNRILRLLPTYWIALVLAVVSYSYLRFVAAKEFAFPWFDEFEKCRITDLIALSIPNLFLLGSDLLYLLSFSGNGEWHFNLSATTDRAGRFLIDSPAWSVGSEIWFYLLVPWIANWRMVSLISVGAVSLALQLYLEAATPWSSYFVFPANLVYFVCGMISFRLFRSRIFSDTLSKFSLPIFRIFAAYLTLRQYIPFVRNYALSVYVPLFLCLPFLFHASKRWQLDRNIGNLSYPLYIIHLPLIRFLELRFAIIDGVSVIAVAMAMSVLILKVVEEPLERYRQRRFARTLVAAA